MKWFALFQPRTVIQILGLTLLLSLSLACGSPKRNTQISTPGSISASETQLINVAVERQIGVGMPPDATLVCRGSVFAVSERGESTREVFLIEACVAEEKCSTILNVAPPAVATFANDRVAGVILDGSSDEADFLSWIHSNVPKSLWKTAENQNGPLVSSALHQVESALPCS